MNKNFKKRISFFLSRQKTRLQTAGRKIEKKVVFESYSGRHYSDNPRFISEKMHELYPDYRLVWGSAGGNTEEYPDYVDVYPISSREYIIERVTAAAYVRNESMRAYLYKKKGQMFIQTWHGDRGIKKILYDSLAARGVSAKGFGYSDDRLTDLFVIGSDYAQERIKTAFRYTGETLKEGCPRNDCLIHPEGEAKVREQVGVKEGQKVLMYAPTLRRNSQVVQTQVDLDRTLRELQIRGGDWVCLVRAHPKSLGLDIENSGRILDCSSYPDISDLLMITDMLITDYSSCAGDFIIKKKPVILAQFDLEQYMKEDRTFHVDPAEAGFLIAHDQDEIEYMIKTMSDEDFEANCGKVMSFFGTHESGHSAEAVCRRINEHFMKVSE